MTQVVQPGLVAGAVGPAHAGVLPEPLEGVLQRPQVNRGPTLAEEEAALDAGRRMRRRSPAGVLGQHACQVLADRDQPRLEELGIPDGEHGVRQVHVRDGQVQRLTARSPAPYSSSRIARRVGGSIRVR